MAQITKLQTVQAPVNTKSTSKTTGAVRIELVGVFDHDTKNAMIVTAREVSND